MSHRIIEVDVDAEQTAEVDLDGFEGVAIVSRRAGRVVGFALHDTSPRQHLTGAELSSMVDPEPISAPPLTVDPARPAPTVTAAICTHDRPELLERCLRSLLDQTDPPDEILVVDNAPSDGRCETVVERIAADAPHVRRIVEPCPGLDIARNAALRHAAGDVVAFIDDDVIADTHWCEATRACFQQDEDVDATTGQVLPAELDTPAQSAFERLGGFRGGNETVRWHGLDLPDNRLYPYHPGMFGAGANMAVRRNSAIRLGGFDEALDTGAPLPGGGDLDLFHRVIRSGGTLRYEPQIVVAHRHRRTHEELRAQYESWGLTFSAWASKAYREDPSGRRKLRLVARYFVRTQLHRAMRDRDPAVRAAASAEIRGALGAFRGPYRRSQRRIAHLRRGRGRPRIALLPWGDVIDDYLHPIGLTTVDLADRLDGGWLFGYIEALDRAGIDVVVVCWSGEVDRPTRRMHAGTGAPIWILPQPRLHRALRKLVDDPYAHGGRAAAGDRRGLDARRARAVRHLLPYTATAPLALRRLLRRESISAILCQEYEEGRFDVCIAIGRALGMPVHATFQGGSFTRSRIERLARSRTVDAAASLIIASDDEAARVLRAHGPDQRRIHAIPNPFDPATLPPVDRAEARRTLGLADDTLAVVWHGRVDIGPKGLDTLVSAWADVVAHSTGDVRLLMVGTGPGAPWLQTQIDSGALTSLDWRDEYVLDRADIANLLAAGDLYVFPSRHEGFPVAPIEAMAVGLPVVATDAPGVARIVGTGDDAAGIIVPIGDADALSAAIRTLLADREGRIRLGRRARARVDTEFSLDAVGVALRDAMLAP